MALVSDLLFSSKITASAAHIGVSVCVERNSAGVAAKIAEATSLLIDMNVDTCDPVELVHAVKRQRPELPVVAFLSHVQKDLAAAARAAGADEVLARSEFTKRLPEILSRYPS